MTAGMETTITGVTVFTDGARVQRTGTADLEAGRQTVVISGLPAALDQASVRVTARGTDLALLNVEIRDTAMPPIRCGNRPRGCAPRSSGAATPCRRSTTRTPPSGRGSISSATCPGRPPRPWPGR